MEMSDDNAQRSPWSGRQFRSPTGVDDCIDNRSSRFRLVLHLLMTKESRREHPAGTLTVSGGHALPDFGNIVIG